MKKNQEPELNALGQAFGEALEPQFEQDSKVSIIQKLDANNLPELIGWKEKQETLLKENPYVEITDSKTYDLACKSRTNLLKGRTELEKQDKAIASKVAAFRKEVGGKTQELIEITLSAEQTQQNEVKRWEGIKEAEKAEKERLENERIDAIKNKASEMESSAFEVIQKMTYAGIIVDSVKVSEIMETEFDFEEFEILFTNAFSRVKSALEEKVKDLTQRENDRIAREEAEKEATAEKAKSDLQAKRLNELLPYNGYGSDVDMSTLWNLPENQYNRILSTKKGVFDSCVRAENERKEKEESDKKAQQEKEEEQKEAIFEIRSKRLIEIGMIYSDEHDTFWTKENEDYILLASEVKDEDTIGFENLLSDSKSLIENSIKKQKEETFEARKNYLFALGFIENNLLGVFELKDVWSVYHEQIDKFSVEEFQEYSKDILSAIKEADEKASKADAAKLKAENKARIKRLADDKNWLSGELEKYFSLAPLEYLTENQETKDFIKSASERIDALKSELLTELENI